MRQFVLQDETATKALGAILARVISPGKVIALEGDLGAGKTTLTRALLHAAGHVGSVKSPTYTLVEAYDLVLSSQKVRFLHFDLYRLHDAREFVEAGLQEDFTHETICVVEWPQKAKGLLPRIDLYIYLTFLDSGRVAKLQALTSAGEYILEQLNFFPNL